jgi:hypothetical protein
MIEGSHRHPLKLGRRVWCTTLFKVNTRLQENRKVEHTILHCSATPIT